MPPDEEICRAMIERAGDAARAQMLLMRCCAARVEVDMLLRERAWRDTPCAAAPARRCVRE